MIYYEDGEYFVVKLNENTYYGGAGFGFYDDGRATKDVSKAQIYRAEWEIHKDLYLTQFLNGKDFTCEYVKVRVSTNVEIITE